MRPIELKMEGFGPFLEPSKINFEEKTLFAITGPTGAGKTTVLDAIVFALYARTPRLGRSYDDLKHPGAEAALVQLDFAVENEVYRVTRRVGRRNEHRLERLFPEGWKVVPESEKARTLNRKIEALLGLDFEAFTRAVLLPQGAFDRFLRGEPKERKDLLKMLFGLGRLDDVQRAAQARRMELKARLERLEGELSALGEGPEPATLAEELEEKRRQHAERLAEVERLRKAYQTLEAKSERFEALASIARRREGLLVQKSGIEAARARLMKLEKARPLVEAWRALVAEESRAAELEKRLNELEEAIAAREQKLAGLPEVEPEAVLKIGARMEALRQRAAGFARLKGWKKRLAGFSPREARGPFDPEQAERLLAAHAGWSRVLAEEKRLEAEKARLEKEAERLYALEAEIEGLGEELERVASNGKAKRAALERLEAEIERQGLAAHRHLLRPGEPCPLCLQPVSEVPPAGGDVERLREQKKALTVELEALRERYQALKAEEAKKRGALEAAKKALEAARTRLEGEMARLTKERAALAESGEPAALLEALGALRGALEAELSGPDPARELARLEAEQKALIERRRARASLQAELERLRAEAGGLRAQRAELERHLAERRAALAAGLGELGLSTPEELSGLDVAPEEIEALRERIRAYEAEWAEVEAGYRQLAEELKGETPPDPGALAEARKALKAAEAEAGALAVALGRLEAELAHARAQEKRRRELEKARAELGQALSIWEKLSLDLRSDRFPEFLLRHYQQGLLARASEILEGLYHGRYRLLSDGGEYYVRDTWTESVRSVRTLSGGESFLASLALALSLSEQLAQKAPAALFLDEGFGTLDRDALEVVADTLAELPRGGRVVGIVTHVEELAERLPARLVVQKSPAGSRLFWVEED